MNQRRRWRWFLPGFILFFLLVVQVSAATAFVITIPEHVIIRDTKILLGNIAVIKGVKGEQMLSLQSIDLGEAPLPGYQRQLNRELIKLILQEEGYFQTEFKLEMPDRVVIETAGKSLAIDSLQSFAEESIRQNLPYAAEKIMIKLTFKPGEIIIPDKAYSLEVGNLLPERLLGTASIPIEIKIDNQVWKRVYLGFEIKLREEVYVAKRNISRGVKIKEEDFQLEMRELSSFRGELISKFNHPLVKDGLVNTPIAKGEILTTYFLKKPVVINWGSEIEAEIIAGNIKVSAMVKARQNGRIGDYIIVENPETGYRFKARIINAHLVRVIR